MFKSFLNICNIYVKTMKNIYISQVSLEEERMISQCDSPGKIKEIIIIIIIQQECIKLIKSDSKKHVSISNQCFIWNFKTIDVLKMNHIFLKNIKPSDCFQN